MDYNRKQRLAKWQQILVNSNTMPIIDPHDRDLVLRHLLYAHNYDFKENTGDPADFADDELDRIHDQIHREEIKDLYNHEESLRGNAIHLHTASVNWKQRYAANKPSKGIFKDLINMFSPNRDEMGNLKKDPSQCKSCGRDFNDAKHPKQNVSYSDYWTYMETGQQHLLPQTRSPKNDDLCKNCDRTLDTWFVKRQAHVKLTVPFPRGKEELRRHLIHEHTDHPVAHHFDAGSWHYSELVWYHNEDHTMANSKVDHEHAVREESE